MRATRIALSTALAAALIVALVTAVDHEVIDETSAVPIGIGIVDVLLAGVAGWALSARVRWRAAGPIVQLTGLWILATLLRHVDLGRPGIVVAGAAWAAGAVLPAVLVWGLPEGVDPARRRAAATTSLVVVALGIAAAIVGGAGGPGTVSLSAIGPWTGTGFTTVLPVSGAARWLLAVQSLVLVGLSGAAVLDLHRRRHRYRLGPESLVDPIVVTGALWTIALAAERVVSLLPVRRLVDLPALAAGDGLQHRPWVGFVALNIPLSATGVLLATTGYALAVRPHLDRLPDGALVLPDPRPETLSDDLATWVGDPTLRITYTDADAGIDAPPRSPDRAQTTLRRDGRRIAVIEHDPALLAAPELIELVATVAGSAIEAEGYAATAEERVRSSRRLAARLVTADRTTRRQLLDEMEAGPLGEVAACIELLGQGNDLAVVVDRLKDATAETRRISHGLFPPELIDGGLRTVFDDRPGAPTRRLPTAVEVTAFLLAANDLDASFVDRGTMLEVRLSTGPSDDDVLDRVRVLGGTCDGSVVELPTGGI